MQYFLSMDKIFCWQILGKARVLQYCRPVNLFLLSLSLCSSSLVLRVNGHVVETIWFLCLNCNFLEFLEARINPRKNIQSEAECILSNFSVAARFWKCLAFGNCRTDLVIGSKCASFSHQGICTFRLDKDVRLQRHIFRGQRERIFSLPGNDFTPDNSEHIVSINFWTIRIL